MGRPREDYVQTEPGVCPKHGKVDFRLHINRWYRGKPYYRKRCPDCLNEQVQAIKASQH